MFLLKHVNPKKAPPIFCSIGVVHGQYEEGIGVDLNVYTNSSILSNMFYGRPHVVANIVSGVHDKWSTSIAYPCRKETSLWMNLKLVIYPKFLLRKNNLLTSSYTEDKVKKAIFQMEHKKAPGPDGFPVEFYQNFWDVIKSYLLAMFSMLHAGQLELYHLNFGEIILLPKVNETKMIEQYRPIFLLNVSSNIFTTVHTISLNTIVVHVV
jgi:hypothetical protein